MESVYVIMAQNDEDTWIQSICRESLTAEEACAKLNSDAKYAASRNMRYIDG